MSGYTAQKHNLRKTEMIRAAQIPRGSFFVRTHQQHPPHMLLSISQIDRNQHMNEHLLPPFRDVFIIADAQIDFNAKILETEGAFSV